MWVWSGGWEDPLEKGMATHCSILAWRILWTEEPDYSPDYWATVHRVVKSQTWLKQLKHTACKSLMNQMVKVKFNTISSGTSHTVSSCGCTKKGTTLCLQSSCQSASPDLITRKLWNGPYISWLVLFEIGNVMKDNFCRWQEIKRNVTKHNTWC